MKEAKLTKCPKCKIVPKVEKYPFDRWHFECNCGVPKEIYVIEKSKKDAIVYYNLLMKNLYG